MGPLTGRVQDDAQGALTAALDLGVGRFEVSDQDARVQDDHAGQSSRSFSR